MATLELYLAKRIDTTIAVADAIVPADLTIMVTVTKRRAPRKAKAAI